MKTYKYLMVAAIMAAGVIVSACDDDDELFVPEVPQTPTGTVSAVGASIEAGAEVNAAAVTEITIQYDGLISLNPASAITLNGQKVWCKVDGQSIIAYVALLPATSYTLYVPPTAVIANKGNSYAEAFSLTFCTSGQAANYSALSNPNASEQAKKVYDFLVSQNGKRILSGAMANVNLNNDFADWLYGISYAYPALAGYDFIHIGQPWVDYNNLAAPMKHWEKNGLVNFMWHWLAPTDEDAYRSGDTSRYGFNVPGGDNPTEFDIREALKEGTWQHEFILADIDRVAAILKKLSEAGVPVIWRPLHEAAGSYKYNNPWFWWGRYGEEATKGLWSLMYDRLVKHHGLNNLIWVWTAQYAEGYEADMAGGYPGNEYVDIVGVDMYEDNHNAQPAAYAAALRMTDAKKMVTLSEVGSLQMPDQCIRQGADWSWFMLWYTHDISKQGAVTDGFGNTPAVIREAMCSPYVINREQMPSLK